MAHGFAQKSNCVKQKYVEKTFLDVKRAAKIGAKVFSLPFSICRLIKITGRNKLFAVYLDIIVQYA